MTDETKRVRLTPEERAVALATTAGSVFATLSENVARQKPVPGEVVDELVPLSVRVAEQLLGEAISVVGAGRDDN